MCWRTVNIFSYVSTFCGLILKFSLTLKFSVCNIDWVFWDLGCFINLESPVTRTMVSPAVVAMQYCTIGLLDTSYMSMTRLVVAQYVSFSCIFIDDKFQLFDYLYSQQVRVTFLPKNTIIYKYFSILFFLLLLPNSSTLPCTVLDSGLQSSFSTSFERTPAMSIQLFVVNFYWITFCMFWKLNVFETKLNVFEWGLSQWWFFKLAQIH